MPPRCYLNADAAEERFGDLARRYVRALDEEDEAGRAALRAFDELGSGGLELLGLGLRGGSAALDGAPDPIRDYFAAIESQPFAVDHDLIELGARALMRHGFGYAGATRQSLFWGYSNGAAVKPLAWTGEMRTADAALGRLVETGEWLQAVIRPGALRPHAAGWQATVRVRLLNARVRAGLWSSGRWDAETWGAPLNGADSAFTLLEFSWMPLRVLRRLGFTYTEREIDGVYALWRYVGHLIGAPPGLNVDGELEAGRMLQLRELTAGPTDSDSRELVRALIDGNLQEDGTPLQRAAGRFMAGVDRAIAVAQGTGPRDSARIPNDAPRPPPPPRRAPARDRLRPRRDHRRRRGRRQIHHRRGHRGHLDQAHRRRAPGPGRRRPPTGSPSSRARSAPITTPALYEQELATVDTKAKSSLKNQLRSLRKSPGPGNYSECNRKGRKCHEVKPAIVLDIDETSLSNYEGLNATNFSQAGLVSGAVAGNDPVIAPTLDALPLRPLQGGRGLLHHRAPGRRPRPDGVEPAGGRLRPGATR